MYNMPNSKNDEIENIVNNYGNMLFRISFSILANKSDAEDAVQETILKYIKKAPNFENKKYEKAWLIKVVTNTCKDIKRHSLRHPEICISEIENIITVSDKESIGIIEALMKIPYKFRIVMILYYVEGYKTKEIANIIKKSSSSVKMRLQKGRKLLEEEFRKENTYGN